MQTQTERAHQRAAFQIYYRLGAKRSYGAVARQMGVSRSAVKNWARLYRWQPRLDARLAYDNQLIVDRTKAAAEAREDRTRKVLDAAILWLARRLAEGGLKGSPRDLPRLEKLKRRLAQWHDHLGAGGPRRAVFLLPDDGRTPTGHPKLHESQVEDFLQSLQTE